MDTSELLRRMENLVQQGTVCEVQEGKALARVQILEYKTDWLPVLMAANSYKRSAYPVRTGEQVVVLSPFGEGGSGIIIGGLFNQVCKEPEGYGDAKEVTVYEDGTTVSYDTEAKELTINASDKITVVAAGDITVECANASVKADTVKVDSPSIDLGLGGKGVVTGECTCAYTGNPHHDFSQNTRSKK